MEFAPEGPKAIPLWVNGHAFLTVTEGFHEVVNPLTGEARYRVPLGGREEAVAAVAAARTARPLWAALTVQARQEALEALAVALDGYSGHFAGLLQAETGFAEDQVLAEVAAALAALRGAAVGESGVVAIVVDATRPLAGFAEAAAPAWRAGATIIVKPSPRAPSAAFALCELSARAGWPAGVLNLMQGDSAAIEGLCRADIDRLVFVGAAALGAKVGAIADSAGKPFAMLEA
ncbi:MAG: aldehyde dehydrogenase [Dechloromonas sp.]|nr:aldehyde dehydrogenase [Dechloromonas sp.]